MILWFGKNKKKAKMKAEGAAMATPKLSADELEQAAPKQTTAPDVAPDTAGDTGPDTAPDIAGNAARPSDTPDNIAAPTATIENRQNDIDEPSDPSPSPAAPQDATPSASIAALSDTAEENPYGEIKAPGFLKKLSTGLSKSSSKLSESISGVFTKRKLDQEAIEEFEDLLLSSDMGAKVAGKIATNLSKSRYNKDVSEAELKLVLAREIEEIMQPREQLIDFAEGASPRIILFVGVNGSGKTTTIGKIATKLKQQGARAMLVAADTFRAAAIEQLKVWGDRAGIPVMSKPTGADPAGLVYEAIEKAQNENLDLVLVDTAGRLQNKTELMSELAKIIRVIRKLDPDAPHEVFLVLDATVGQNALSQVEAFKSSADVTGLVMTKLDGTAKGGVLVAIAEAYALPIHFVGVGEKAEDLQPFSAEAYAKALVGLDTYSAAKT